ncbi:TPA: ABC transporter permease [Candidatus Bathyarchaeota archaeon]|nr:ABC transporter permease [Candidatus Bathyarchaeota archaeon]
MIEKAENAIRSLQYDLSYGYSLSAWSLGLASYRDIRNTTEDSASTIVFFALLLIPFTVLVEKMFFHAEGKRRVISIVGVFLSMVIFLYFVHPGFTLAANSMMVFLGIMTSILLVPVLAITMNNFLSLIKRSSIKLKGIHFAEISKGSAAMLAFSLGAENMRKRKLRFALVLTTIILLVGALVMFTSVTTMTAIKPVIRAEAPPYPGVYIKIHEWGHLQDWLGENIVNVLKSLYAEEANVYPRAWLYTSNPRKILMNFNLAFGSKVVNIYSMLGMTYDYAKLVQPLITEGRWFMPGDNWVCILTEDQARKLGIKSLPAKVTILDINFTVVGILKGQLFDALSDLDGEAITPLDAAGAGPDVFDVHVSIERTLIIQYHNAMSLGASVASVSIIFKDPALTVMAARDIFNKFPGLLVYAAFNDSIYLYASALVVDITGWQMQLILLILCSLIILNTMLASVQERRREIFTFSSVGLSPLHVAFLFLAEAMVYAIIGGILGYSLAMLTSMVIFTTIQEAVIGSFSSRWVVAAVGISMGMTMFSTLYPAVIASKLVTPSLERIWKIPTKPCERDWEIPLPFVASTDKEAVGIIRYLAEYAEAHVAHQAETFSARKISFHEEKEGIMELKIDTRLEPYERGVKQDTRIILMKDDQTGIWKMIIYIYRTSGGRKDWMIANRNFLDKIRKQMLIWRSLPPKERLRYLERIKDLER